MNYEYAHILLEEAGICFISVMFVGYEDLTSDSSVYILMSRCFRARVKLADKVTGTG